MADALGARRQTLAILKTVVIGGAGFIGSQLCRLLVESGREVIVVGRSAHTGIPRYIQGNYGDPATLRRILEGADEVVDLAYATAPQTSFADPMFDLQSNVPASVTLLQEASTVEVRKLVLVSSGGTVYGVTGSLPIDEDHTTKPISPYGITKLAIENYAWMYHAIRGLPVVVVRPGNAYGEGQRRLSGQGFIAAAMQRIIERREVDIYGGTGTIRDYIHVADVAAGIVAALDKGAPGLAYNIGTGIGSSNLDILHLLEPLAAEAGLAIRKRALPARQFDVPVNILDSSRLNAASGWRPRTLLEEGVARMWRAIRVSQGS
jgi:UDP-glucose 4-epimerase